MITTNLLQALLSPDASQRQAAELQLRQGTVSALCTGLLQALQSQPSHLAHLAAVLLRREIIALADATQVELMIEPLLLTLHDHPSASAVGDCLAEVCASLQWLDPTKSVEAVQHILKVSADTDD